MSDEVVLGQIETCCAPSVIEMQSTFIASGTSNGQERPLKSATRCAPARRMPIATFAWITVFCAACGQPPPPFVPGEARLWDLNTNELQHRFEALGRAVTFAAFTPDGATLITSSVGDQELSITPVVRFWNATTGKYQASLPRGTCNGTCIALAPNGKMLATGNTEGTTFLFDVPTGGLVAKFEGHASPIIAVAFSPDSKTVASAGKDEVVRLWDTSTHRLRTMLRGHRGSMGQLLFSPDGKTLATTPRTEFVVVLWDLETGQERATLSASGILAFSPNGRTLATLRPDDAVRIWDISAAKECAKLEVQNPAARILKFSPDGKTIATTSHGVLVNLSHAGDGREIGELRGHKDIVRCVAFSPDGSTLATGSRDGVVMVWNLSTNRPIATLRGHVRTVYCIAFSPDGRSLIVGAGDIEPHI